MSQLRAFPPAGQVIRVGSLYLYAVSKVKQCNAICSTYAACHCSHDLFHQLVAGMPLGIH